MSDLEGGCLCGAVRYRVTGDSIAVVYCHCSMCRRASGAAVVNWAMFPQEQLAIVQGTPAIYASSPGVERSFCGSCGTQLTFRADFMPGLVDLTVGSLDDPTALPPQMHIWEKSRVPWLQLADALPRHDGIPPQA
jgi:hypothetical protein